MSHQSGMDRNRVVAQRKALKRDLVIYVGCFLLIFPIMVFGSAFKGQQLIVFTLIAVAWALTFFAEFFIIIFRIRFLCRAMGKSITVATLYQLLAFLMPLPGLGVIIVALILFRQSSKTLNSG